MFILLKEHPLKFSVALVMHAIRSSRKNKFKEAAIVGYWHDFRAGPIKTINSHAFSLSRGLFYDYLGYVQI